MMYNFVRFDEIQEKYMTSLMICDHIWQILETIVAEIFSLNLKFFNYDVMSRQLLKCYLQLCKAHVHTIQLSGVIAVCRSIWPFPDVVNHVLFESS